MPRTRNAPLGTRDSVSRETLGRRTPRRSRSLSAVLVSLTAALCLVMSLALAQQGEAGGGESAGAPAEGEAAGENRIITIDGSGGTQRGNLRFGPIDRKSVV